MPFFAANGIEIGLSVRSGSRTPILVGSRNTAFSGQQNSTVRALADQYEAVTLPMSKADAFALFQFLRGDGHNFRFAAAGDYYSGKWLAGTPTSDPIAGGANGHLGASNFRITLDSNDYVSWTPTGVDALTGDYTLLVWHLLSTGPDVWGHKAVRVLNGGAPSYWEGGIEIGGAGDVTWEAKLSVTAGVLKLGDGANADVFSDLVAVPFGMPDAWIPEVVTATTTRQFPNRPHLEVSGDMVNRAATAPIVYCATVNGFDPVPFAGSDDGGVVSFTLRERKP